MRYAISLLLLILPLSAAAQSVPPRFDDLPPALARELAETKEFEKLALERVGKLLQSEPTAESYRLAEMILSATLRHHLSVRRAAPLAENPWRATEAELQDRIANVRKDWLAHARDDAEALRLADAWLPVTPADGPLRNAILKLWLAQATAALEKKDIPAVRAWLQRLEANFEDAQVEALRKPLRARAESLLKADPKSIRALEEALELWPRLPEARDALERNKGTYRTLVVGVRSLPTQLSPATASTEVEMQSLTLLFDALYHAEQQAPLGRRYRPLLAAALPADAGLTSSIELRRDAYWSSGERVTAADVRHTALLMNKNDAPGRSALWREFLDIPRFDGNAFHLSIRRHQGLLDPLAPLTFHVLPQYYRGQQLHRADDADFAQSPVGSGPFQYLGVKKEAGKSYAHFQANPHDLRKSVSHLREIRMVAFSDPSKLAKPLPELILDAPTDQLAALKKLGYAEVPVPDGGSVCCLAVNQRKPAFASTAVRRAIALGLDRKALLEGHFCFGTDHHASANGLFPRASWATCPAPRVPAELYDADLARSFARKAKMEIVQLEWTLKYPAGDVRVQAACEAMASKIAALFQEARIKVKAIPLPPMQLRKALAEHDYDLLYMRMEHLDDPVRLALLFDPGADALRVGGSNFLGCEDVKLQELVHAALKHRQFGAAQAAMHSVHAYLNETMPAIPLWHLDLHLLAQPSLRLPALDAPVFAHIHEWRVP
jgi:peptide/nickel transport system substrate-binding protein